LPKDRQILAQILKLWAQDHDHSYVISDPASGDLGVSNTGGYLSWVIKSGDGVLDLVGLLDRLELYLDRVRGSQKIDGMFCRKCQLYYQYAEANQPDGSLLCFVCRNYP
jgi:hypothetical protein